MSSNKSTWHGVAQILRFAKAYWKLILITIIAINAATACELVYLSFARPFIEAIARAAESFRKTGEFTMVDLNTEQLMRIGKYALLLAPVMAAATFAQHYFQGRTVWRLTVKLRNKVCQAILPQSLSFFEGRRSGDLMSRITNDVSRSKQAFTLMYGDIPEQGVKLLGSLALAAVASWQLLLLCLVVVPFMVLPIGYMAKRIRRYGKQGLERLGDLTDLMTQMFSGIRVIKAFKMEQAEAEEFERINNKVFRRMMKSVTARSLSQGMIELIVRAFIGASALLGTYMMMRGSLPTSLGRMFVCIGAMYYAFNSMRKLTKGYNELQEFMPASDRIFELIEYVPSLQDAPDAVTLERVENGIAFRNVSFSYGGERVLHDVTFEANRGETIAVVGRSGAGKSTLIALLCRFYEVSEGAVEIDGIDVRQITRDSLLNQFTMVTQQTFLFNRSIAENIRYGRPSATMEEVEAAARAANIHDFITALPEGYESLCGEFGAKLSGGQRQRIAIARALLKNADILILDEAMVGLDVESENAVREALERLMRGRTTFVITHDLPTIQTASRILVLSQGRLVGNGTHEELMAQDGEYRAMFALQFATLTSGPATPLSEY